MREHGIGLKPTASLRFFDTGPPGQSTSDSRYPLWIYTRDQYRAGEKDDMTHAVIRTLPILVF